eukprot:scaffold29380_cov70-Phaeocystis_antarctica.AAC.3
MPARALYRPAVAHSNRLASGCTRVMRRVSGESVPEEVNTWSQPKQRCQCSDWRSVAAAATIRAWCECSSDGGPGWAEQLRTAPSVVETYSNTGT